MEELKNDIIEWEKVHNEFGDLTFSYEDYLETQLAEGLKALSYWDWIEQEYMSFLEMMNE